MSTRSISSSRLLAAVLVLGLTAAACSGGAASLAPGLSAAPNGSHTATAAQTAASTPQLPTNSAAPAIGTNICALLPADQVAQITGLTISGSTPLTNFLTVNDARCQYGEDNEVVIDVISPGGTAFYDDLVSQYGGNVSPITGIGDRAFQDFTDGSGLVSLFGDAAYNVYISNPNDVMSDDDVNRVSEQLITTLRAKL